MALRMVTPLHPVRLPLSDGEWIEVKAQLNHEEHQDLMEAFYVTSERGELLRQPQKWADAIVVAYLVDWSLTTTVIRGRPRAEIQSALNNLEQESFREIQDAIEAHADRIAAERAEKKTIPSGGHASAPISLSLVAATGGTNG